MADTKDHYCIPMPLWKSHVTYGVYIKRPQQATPQRQKVDEQLPETGGKGELEVTGNGYVAFLGERGLMKIFWNWIEAIVAKSCEYTEIT